MQEFVYQIKADTSEWFYLQSSMILIWAEELKEHNALPSVAFRTCLEKILKKLNSITVKAVQEPGKKVKEQFKLKFSLSEIRTLMTEVVSRVDTGQCFNIVCSAEHCLLAVPGANYSLPG